MTRLMGAGWEAGKACTLTWSAEENRMPTKSRFACRAWSSSARAHALAHASAVIPSDEVPPGGVAMEKEQSTQAMIAPRPVGCSPRLS